MIVITDPTAPQPIYLQIAHQVIEQIISGDIAHGDRLPTAKDLAESLGLNRNTVLQAYHHLRDENYLDLRRGRGAIALSPASESSSQLLQSAVNQLIRIAKSRGLTLSAVTDLLARGGLT